MAFVFLFYTERHPQYNWDMIAYMGVVQEYEGVGLRKAHDSVYNMIKRDLPKDAYNVLTAKVEDQYECLIDAKAYENELSFFRTKPLYTFTVYCLHKLGVNLVTATYIPSFFSCFVLILLIFHWLNQVTKPVVAFIIAVLLMLLPKFAELCRLSSPDAISNMLILLSIYLIHSKSKRIWIYIALAFSVLARIDNFIFVIVILGFQFFNQKNTKMLLLVTAGVSLLALLLIPMLLGDSYNWFMKFAFLFSVDDYLRHWKFVLFDFRYPSYMFIAIIAVLLLAFGNSTSKELTRMMLITFVIRCILFPSLQERFFIAYEFAVVVLAVHHFSMVQKNSQSKGGVGVKVN
ncbi:MAG TPA: hypothetical protein VL098_11760 [Flavipsychrobacter sp.]|nr:hypothetical protein [Flavipsychrobacter sp.]